MEKRPMTDRAASGYDEGRTPASPQIAVFSDTGSPATNAGPATDRPEPASHDIYRRPANAIPFRRPAATHPDQSPIGSPTAGAAYPAPAGGFDAEPSTDAPAATSAFAERTLTDPTTDGPTADGTTVDGTTVDGTTVDG
ncbi:MAG TPA: hypothetical protein VF755_17285, partial [Catenuloplanes sp.]